MVMRKSAFPEFRYDADVQAMRDVGRTDIM